MVNFLEAECRKHRVDLRTGMEVLSVDWRRKPISIRTRSGADITADRVIITVPIGVLRSASIRFDPIPETKFEAIHALQMGCVTKVVLEWKQRFWPEENFGFIHATEEPFATWWADERGNLLTGWAGGPGGEELASLEDRVILERALETTAKLFGESLPVIRKLLVAGKNHHWTNDPFARGAYSFIPVNGTDAYRELARPENDVLYFAGEATDLNYQFGTVHGAIASAIRAVRDIVSHF